MGFIEDKIKPLIDQVVSYFGTVHSIIGDHTTLNEPSVIEELRAVQLSLQSDILSLINDNLISATDKTYSINKIKSLIQESKDSILSNVSTNGNTLEKLENLINGVNTVLSTTNGNVALLQSIVGDPSQLDTVDKDSLVDAINEVLTYSQNIIDDTASVGVTDKTYSVDKLLQLYQQLKNDILGGAGNAYDTLLELQQELQSNDMDIASILNEQAKRVAVNITQSFTTLEQTTARNNIGVYSKGEIDAFLANLQTLIDDIEDEQGDAGDLTTGLSSTLVQGINWLHLQIQDLQTQINNVPGDLIDDNALLGTTDKTYSVNKILTITNGLQSLIDTLTSSIGILPDLNTTEKSNLVEAINELFTMVESVATIDDLNISTTSTYSSDKIETLVNSLRNEILGGASGAYDTLLELQNAIQDNDSDITQILTNIAQLSILTSEIANDRVAYNIDQTVTTTSGEKSQARQNIDVYSTTQVNQAIQTAKDEIIGGASAGYDTLGEIETIINDIYNILSSDDPSLDTFQKVVDYIKNNASDIAALQATLGSISDVNVILSSPYGNLSVDVGDSQSDFNDQVGTALENLEQDIDSLERGKINKSSIIDNLTTGGTTNVLSAQQGVVLKGLIDNITSLLNSDNNALDTLQEIVDFIEINRDILNNLSISNVAGLQTQLTSLQNQINNLNSTLANVYTKTEVDNLLAGKANLNHNHDDRYYTETEVDSRLALKSDTNHTHDNRYYTEGEVNSLLASKSDVGHNHDDRYYTESESDSKYGTALSLDGLGSAPTNIRLRRQDGSIISTVTLASHANINGISTQFGAFAQDGTLVRVTVNNGVISAITPSTTYGGSQDYISGNIW